MAISPKLVQLADGLWTTRADEAQQSEELQRRPPSLAEAIREAMRPASVVPVKRDSSDD